MALDFLARDDAPFDESLWQRIDSEVVEAAKQIMVGRRFLPVYGPMGPGASVVKIDTVGHEEVVDDGFAVMEGRQVVQLPQLYEDFWLYWRDIENAKATGRPLEISSARMASEALARREDEMIFYGVDKLGIKGLLNAPGVVKQKLGDWKTGETPFTTVATGIDTLLANGRIGRHTLILSSDLYVQIQRIQPGTGLLESDRVAKLLDGRLLRSTVLKPKTALLVCPQPQYMDLAVGVDIHTAYTEAVDLNHHLRVLETAIPRVKSPDAIIVMQ